MAKLVEHKAPFDYQDTYDSLIGRVYPLPPEGRKGEPGGRKKRRAGGKKDYVEEWARWGKGGLEQLFGLPDGRRCTGQRETGAPLMRLGRIPSPAWVERMRRREGRMDGEDEGWLGPHSGVTVGRERTLHPSLGEGGLDTGGGGAALGPAREL